MVWMEQTVLLAEMDGEVQKENWWVTLAFSENVSTNTVFLLVGSSRGSWYRW